MSNLEGVILAFDIDNTLLDPDGTAYRRTVAGFLSLVDLGVAADKAAEAYEKVRSYGGALERLGFANPLHVRGNAHGLAAMCLAYATNAALRADLGVKFSRQQEHREVLGELASLHGLAGAGSFEDRLRTERRVRSLLATDDRVARFRNEVERVAHHPRIVEWSYAYPAIERRQPLFDVRPFIESTGETGAIPAAITDGRSEVQLEKLRRLGLADLFRGRVLVTEAAAAVAGLGELDEALTSRLGESESNKRPPEGDDLLLLWRFRCLIDLWDSKSPAFFGRCLHALRALPQNAQAALRTLTIVPTQEWGGEPLRFVMIGDRYDRDVLPLIELLGGQAGMTIRLRQGKYANLHAEHQIESDRRPDRVFGDWNSLGRFLTGELSADQVRPIASPPGIAPSDQLRPDHVRRGLKSGFEAVRAVAAAVSRTV